MLVVVSSGYVCDGQQYSPSQILKLEI